MNAKIIVVGTAFVAAAAAAFYAIYGKYPAVEVVQLQQPKLKVETYLVSVAKGKIVRWNGHFRRFSTTCFTCQVEARCLSFER